MADRLRDAALACCNAGGDIESVAEFLDILKAPFQVPARGREWQLECEGLLTQARSLLDPSVPSGKELMDHVGDELVKVALQYLGVSKDCQEISNLLIEDLAAAFDPAREMFTSFLEGIDLYSKPQTLHLCLPLLRGLSKLFPRIRRPTEFVKVAVPCLVEVGRSAGQDEADVSSDSEDYPDRLLLSRDHMEDNVQHKAIEEVIRLAEVIKGICDGGQEMEKLRNILGIFSLQLLSVVCGATDGSSPTIPKRELELMELLSSSTLSLSTLVSTTEFDKILATVFDEEDTKAQKNQLEAKRGAALAVYWGIQTRDPDNATKEIAALKQRIQTPSRHTVLAIISLASTLLVHVPCTQEMSLMHKGLSLMTSILEVYFASSSNDDASQVDDHDVSIQIRPALNRLQDVIVYIPSPILRRQAYGILIKIITQDLPTRARFDTLLGLIASSSHPSLASLLLSCVKDEVLKSWPVNEGEQELRQDVDIETSSSQSPFTSPEVQEFIQCVLRRKDGELAELPTNLDAVVGALNLYRFLLIRESSSNTNYTSMLSREELVKGRTYWLLPLREQILRIQGVLKGAGAGEDHNIQLGMDTLQSVVYRCLEIVEQLLAKLPN